MHFIRSRFWKRAKTIFTFYLGKWSRSLSLRRCIYVSESRGYFPLFFTGTLYFVRFAGSILFLSIFYFQVIRPEILGYFAFMSWVLRTFFFDTFLLIWSRINDCFDFSLPLVVMVLDIFEFLLANFKLQLSLLKFGTDLLLMLCFFA